MLRTKCRIYGIYGDRGVKGYGNRLSDLCLSDDVLDKISFYFVDNSCHMPMVENPEMLSDIHKNVHISINQRENAEPGR